MLSGCEATARAVSVTRPIAVGDILSAVKTLKAEQIDGQEERHITLPSPRGAMEFKGQAYLLGFVTPNLYFHCTTTYAILRHNGVEVGKMDFIGAP